MKRTPLTIGNLTFEYPFVLAPLAGITDKTMRSLCSQAGASLTYTEMVSAKGLWYGDRKTGELLQTGPEEGPVGFQLFGSEPEILGYAVRILSDPSHAKAVDAQMEEMFAAVEMSSETAAVGEGPSEEALPSAGERMETPMSATAGGGSLKAVPVAEGSGSPIRAAVSRPPMGARTVTDLEPPASAAASVGSLEAAPAAENSSNPIRAAVSHPPMGARTVTGLEPPALFDLNAGCPVSKIVRNGEGSALLKDPDLL